MKIKQLKPKGYIIYDGQSQIDGLPIVVIALEDSKNNKTGKMLQTLIVRKDIDPITASRTGADYSICGSCIHRGVPHNGSKGGAKKRSCYVMLLMVLSVYKAYIKGNYKTMLGHKNIQSVGDNQFVRLGTYGDPAAVPSYIWESLLSNSKGHTAYSHQANIESADFRPDIFMRSADNLTEAKQAWQNGERTFRVTTNENDVVKGKEIICPATPEGGQKTNCIKCLLCSGNTKQAKSIAVVVHGAGKKHFATA
tara:strand:+ start:364 stop:1119 length:756 start_codon:yes stop_codon:yes gene_type:complete